MPDNKKDIFKLPIPGLSTCPPKGVSVNDEMLVEIAKCNLIELLSDPYNYEAIRLLIREKHPLISSFKKGGRRQGKGELARSIINSDSKKEKRRPGRPKIHRPGMGSLLAYIEREQQKPGEKRSLEWHSHEIVNTMCSKSNVHKRKKLAKDLCKELKNEKRRQKYKT